MGTSYEAATHVHIPPAALFLEPVPSLPTGRHPFHPSLEYYIGQRPYTRVKWLIPVHGPVAIPGLAEESGAEEFLPSDGHLALDIEEYRQVKRMHRHRSAPSTTLPSAVASSSTHMARNLPRPLVVTEQLLRAIWNKLVRLSKLGRFGPIALALSSFQPDPFRPIEGNQRSIIERHKCNLSPSVGESTTGNDTRPVKPEVGDHIKLFCDLRYAMAIRSVLRGMEIGDGTDSATHATSEGQVVGSVQNNPEAPTERAGTRLAPTHSSATSRSSRSTSTRPLMPFRGVKLCLVGERGEVLIVV